jgi:hypothetical protein
MNVLPDNISQPWKTARKTVYEVSGSHGGGKKITAFWDMAPASYPMDTGVLSP